MSETIQWSEGYITYNIFCVEPVWSISLTLETNSGFIEAEFDAGIEAFASYYNTLHTVNNITKLYTGTGVSSYDYVNSDGVWSDLGDGVTVFANGGS